MHNRENVPHVPTNQTSTIGKQFLKYFHLLMEDIVLVCYEKYNDDDIGSKGSK